MRNLSGSFEVFDDRIPYIIFHSIIPGIQVNHSDNAIINFEIREPMGGAGFNIDGSSLQVYYKKNSVPNNPTDGTQIFCVQTTSPYGGIYQVVIPESVFAYLDTIYFWGNVSDIKGNKNNTFLEFQTFTVVDQVAPTIIIDPSSQADNSYQLDKTIQFSVTEPGDGSLMNSTEIFWKLEDPMVSPTNFGGYDVISVTGIGGSRTFTLLSSQINGRYGQRVYFFIRANDTLGNLRTTSTTYFTISDNVLPNFNENTKNLLDILNNNGKNFSVEAWDLDYPLSSGIASVTLYYRLNNSAVGTGSGEYTAILTIMGSINADRKNYTLNLSPLTTTTWVYQTEFYYKILVIDVKGNQYLSPTANHFTVFPAFSVNIASPIAANPNQKLYYYNSSTVQISVTTGQACNIWYQIDGNPSGESPVFGTSYTTTVSGFSEGYHNITIYYFNEIHYRIFEFYMDFTPPSIVTNMRAQVQGNVIIISWQPPSNADPLTTYEIWKKTGTGQFVKIATIEGTQYIDPAIQGSQKYQYKIITIDRAGNISEFSNTIMVKTAMPGWMLIIIIAGIAIGAVLGMRIAISTKRNKTLRELGSMSIEEQGKLFDSIPSQEQQLTEEQKAEQRKKIRGVEDNVFVDTQEIKKELWQQIDWKSKDEYWKKRSEKFNEFLSEYIISALKSELNKDYATALKIYLLALRTAELDKNIDLDVFDFLRNKIYEIYSNPQIRDDNDGSNENDE